MVPYIDLFASTIAQAQTKFDHQLDHNAPNSKLYARARVFAKRSIYIALGLVYSFMRVPCRSAVIFNYEAALERKKKKNLKGRIWAACLPKGLVC